MLRTLSALSYSKKFLSSPINGFPKKEKKLEKKIRNDDQIYDNLRNYYNTVVSNNESIYSPQKSDPRSPQKEADTAETIYDDIYQTICSPRKSRMSLDILSPKKSKREFPIKEFSETEDKYLANLIMVRDNFRDPLVQFLSEPIHQAVFFRLDELIALHSDILLDLKRKKVSIGQVMLRHCDKFVVYKEYCTNLTRAQTGLEAEEQKNPKLKKELTKCQIRAKSPFPLCAHIVLPFQRLLKYHIMLVSV